MATGASPREHSRPYGLVDLLFRLPRLLLFGLGGMYGIFVMLILSMMDLIPRALRPHTQFSIFFDPLAEEMAAHPLRADAEPCCA